MALFIFALLYMPLTAQAFPENPIPAVLDGRIFQSAWRKSFFPGSPALLPLGLAGALSPEAMFICKIAISMMVPLLLTPWRIWVRLYSGACVLLAMYSMNS